MADAAFDDFSERKLYRNLGLEAEGQTFWVAREAMAEHSSVFTKMLYGEFQETNKDVIPLPGKSAQEILELLRCLFTGKEVNDENVDVLLKLGDEYEIPCLMKQCKKVLIDQMKSTMEMKVGEGEEKIIKLFLTAVRYKMKEIIRGTLPVAARYGLAKLQPFFDDLAVEVRCAVSMQLSGQSAEHAYVQKLQTCFSCRGRSTIDSCDFCNFAFCCSSCCSQSKDRHAAAALCVICHACRKSMIFGLSKCEIQLSSGCQCINPLADEELKKIGL